MVTIQSIIDKINHQIMDEADVNRAIKVLRGGFLSKPDGGPMVVQFQNQMAAAHNQKYAVAVNSGTSAVHCAIAALELKPCEEVLVPVLANIVDASTVIQEGGRPVFVDIDPNSFNIDPEKIEIKINKNTRAIIVVHMYGQPVKIDEIKKISKKHNLVLIEDCAQAAGAKYKDKYVGSFGDISCFSLYQTKHIISGEGGVVMTSNDKFSKIISSVANNGIMKDDLDAYDYNRIGYNYQLTEIQGTLAIGQLKKLDKNNSKRRKNVELFKKLLKDIDITFQRTNSDSENVYFYLTGLLPKSLLAKRDKFIQIVKQLNTPIKKLYPMGLNEMTLLKNKYPPQDCPISQDITKRVFNLYVNPGLDKADITFMANAVREAYKKIQQN
ncbi:MAG: DegT/DnrJ/EryC1/StrS family aminotransferase [bacterium]|nr:DegT/DnrJ/EryC1/StrS family aminotransferase [bacterium]